MSTNQPNPYTSPQTAFAPPGVTPQGNIDPALLQKIETIIKDAGQFWLAILMCVVCTGFGALFVAPWYLFRLIQWHSVARQNPLLLDPQVPRGSIAQRFQSAKLKLILGVAGGGLLLLFVVSSIVIMSLLGP